MGENSTSDLKNYVTAFTLNITLPSSWVGFGGFSFHPSHWLTNNSFLYSSPRGNGGWSSQVHPVSIVCIRSGVMVVGYPGHQEHRSSSANTFGDCHQVRLSVWTQTPPEMVIQGQVSLVSHKVNLKVTPEWLGQEKYYKALCLDLNEFNFPSCKTRWPVDRAQCVQVNRAGRSIQTSLLSRINDEKEKAVKGGRRGSLAGDTAPVFAADRSRVCFSSWILFSQLCLSPPAWSHLYSSSSTAPSNWLRLSAYSVPSMVLPAPGALRCPLSTT